MIQLILFIAILMVFGWVVDMLVQREINDLKSSVKMYKQWIKNGKASLNLLNEKTR